ncbi:hypothetical protein Terro_0278 [Terriglobus roseus DSM 18391]|uniref:DUF3108 domain-containing protein n=1 Tax=Terriglobus roseus (strain DSM 18391 / NRRL B-41598 / KBS 63) TaxID=926566 RepID=I3ZBK9_TERRK|nr:hypothetical protein [Terriglobus roseus]AFL86627.1 hypothetical protein Terro_0278 [Terriglobus roseus DSM 18391]
MLRRVLFGLFLISFAVPVVRAEAQTVHAPDGGSFERLQSIDVPEKPGAPFRATVITSWKRRLEDGTEFTVYNRRTIARDSVGHVFQERRYLKPNGNTQTTPVTSLEYYDPVRNEMTQCTPVAARCVVQPWRMDSGGAASLPAVTAFATGGKITRESLGEKSIENLQVTGSREISTIRMGQSEPTIKEFWYAPLLGINVVVKRFEPRGGAENFSVEQIDRNEPDPRLFQPPQGFQIVNMPASTRYVMSGEVTPTTAR